MFIKLFAMYPPRPDAEMTTAAYIDETRDIPPLVISNALKRLVRKAGEFAPSVVTIRKECALYLRERHRQAEGLDPHGGFELDADLTERWLKRSGEPLLALSAGTEKVVEIPAPKSERDRAIAILDAEIARLEGRMRVRS